MRFVDVAFKNDPSPPAEADVLSFGENILSSEELTDKAYSFFLHLLAQSADLLQSFRQPQWVESQTGL